RCEQQSRRDTDRNTDQQQTEDLFQRRPNYVRVTGAQRDPDPDLVRAPRHLKRRHAIDSRHDAISTTTPKKPASRASSRSRTIVTSTCFSSVRTSPTCNVLSIFRTAAATGVVSGPRTK